MSGSSEMGASWSGRECRSGCSSPRRWRTAGGRSSTRPSQEPQGRAGSSSSREEVQAGREEASKKGAGT